MRVDFDTAVVLPAGMSTVFDVEAFLGEERRLRALARRLVEDEHEAEDAVQTAVTQTLQTRKPGVGVAAMLHRAVAHRARDARKLAIRRRARERAGAAEAASAPTVEVVAQAELRRALLEAVVRLNEPYRSTIWQRFYESLPPREIARRTGVPVTTVHTRLQRALAQLRGSLDARYGDRRAWAALLVPLLRSPTASGTTAALLGGLMAHKWSALAVGAMVCVLCCGGWLLLAGKRADRLVVAPAPDALQVAVATGADDVERATATVREVVRGERILDEPAAAVAHGTLRFADGRPVADAAYWCWDRAATRPAWTRPPRDGWRFVAAAASPSEPVGRTAADGSWRLPEAASSAGAVVMFRILDHLAVSFEVAASGATSLAPPALAELSFYVRDGAPDDHWACQVWPAVPDPDEPDDPISGVHLVTSVETTSGRAVVLQDFAQRRDLRGDESFRLLVPDRGLHWFEAIGHGATLGDDRSGSIAAPAVRGIEIIGRGAAIDIEIREPGGGRARVAGLAIHWRKGEADRRWYEELTAGHARLWDLARRPGSARELRVLLADGERFERSIDLNARPVQRVVLVRGQGEKPRLDVALPDGFPGAEAGQRHAVYHETRGGALVYTPFFTDQMYGEKTSPASYVRDGDVLRFSALPDDWTRLLIVTRSGRVAEVRHPVGSRAARAAWLPDDELERIDLRELTDELEDGGWISLSIELAPEASGAAKRWVMVDRYVAGDWPVPVWDKRCPVGLRQRVRVATPGGTADRVVPRK